MPKWTAESRFAVSDSLLARATNFTSDPAGRFARIAVLDRRMGRSRCNTPDLPIRIVAFFPATVDCWLLRRAFSDVNQTLAGKLNRCK